MYLATLGTTRTIDIVTAWATAGSLAAHISHPIKNEGRASWPEHLRLRMVEE
jgi:hypothetical protein